MRSTFWANRSCERQSCHNRHTRLKFASAREKSALSIKVVQNEIMRSTFWPNRIFESQSSHNRHTRLKFASKRENSALFMKIVQNALFRSCAARFGQIAFLSIKVVKIVTLASNSLQKGKLCAFHENCTIRSFQVMRSRFWANRICERQSSQNRHTGLKFSPKTVKQCAFHENCTKRSFQVMGSTFWPNRIFERQSSNNRHTGLKFASKREKSALHMKIVQNALFRSCAARYGQIAVLSVKVLTIVTLASNSLQKRKTVRFSWKLYKTVLWGHAQHVLPNSHFWASKLSKSSHWPQILSKYGKQCAFHENCTKRSFQVTRSTFWPNRICEQGSQNRHPGLKFSSKRKHSALSMKVVHNALFRSCAVRFGQIKLLSFKVLKIVTLASNSLQNGKTVRFLWKLYKQNAIFRSCAARFGQIAFVSVKVLKIVTLAWISCPNGKTVRFPWKLYKTLFSGHGQHVLAKSHFWASKF